MKTVILRLARQSPAVVLAMVALFVALTGTAVATTSALITVGPGSPGAALADHVLATLAPGAAVLAFDYGHFSAGFAAAARRLLRSRTRVPINDIRQSGATSSRPTSEMMAS
jgi:aspartate aminotransferase-like enzyme